MDKICRRCGKEFNAKSNRCYICEDCKIITHTKSLKNWQSNKNLGRVPIYNDDITYIKSIKGDVSMYDYLHKIIMKHKNSY